MPNQTGKTTSSVNFRSAPEVRPDTIIRGLAANTPVEVTGEQGEWYTVIVEGQNGFIKKEFILLASQGVADGFLVHRMSEFASIPLQPPDDERVEVVAGMSGTEKLAANIWNKFGGLLNVLSAELKIDPAVAVAVFAVESGGRGFGDDGRCNGRVREAGGRGTQLADAGKVEARRGAAGRSRPPRDRAPGAVADEARGRGSVGVVGRNDRRETARCVPGEGAVVSALEAVCPDCLVSGHVGQQIAVGVIGELSRAARGVHTRRRLR